MSHHGHVKHRISDQNITSSRRNQTASQICLGVVSVVVGGGSGGNRSGGSGGNIEK